LPFTMACTGVAALLKGWVVPRWFFDRELERTEYWQNVAERALNINERQQTVVTEVVKKAGLRRTA
jgi:hypothetical protein